MVIVNFDTYFAANGGGKTLDVTWQEACALFAKPKATLDIPYMQDDGTDNYKAWKKKVDDAKRKTGYVFWGETKNGKKDKDSIVNHSAIAIDYDGMQNKSFIPEPKCNYLLYSTTKHNVNDPHYRLIIPLSRPVVGDEYQYISRKVLAEIGSDGVDNSSFQDNRAMGYTVLLKGSEYVYKAITDKDFLDVDKYLVDGWQDAESWQLTTKEKKELKQVKARVASGDAFLSPTDIAGYPGAMCRAYSISAGIKEFLPDIYEPYAENRYTYKNASGMGGLRVYNDNLAFSYHSTDPANDGKPHNIYSLVQIHTGYNKRQMTELCKANANIMREFKGITNTVNIEIPEVAENWINLSMYPANDYGIALRLYDLYSAQVGWATDTKSWLQYNGVQWSDADMSEMYALFPRVADIMRALSSKVENGDTVRTIAQIISCCETSHYRESALKALKAMIMLKRGDMDADNWGMNTPSGFLKLNCSDNYILDNDYTQHCTKRAGGGFSADFVPDKECLHFLETTIPDGDVRHWFQKFCGYCLTGSTREKLGVFLHAAGNNGKTVFINLMQNAFGDYCEAGDEKLITTNRYGGDANSPTPSLASLAGARICLYDEIKSGKKIDSMAWKRITGASPMKARKLQQAPFNFTPQCKLIVACNNVPFVEDAHDKAMRIRIRIVPFTATFTSKNIDKTIEDKIKTQSWKDTFIYWCFEGLQYYLADGLDNYDFDTNLQASNLPTLMKQEAIEYFKDSDDVGDFLTTYCEVTHNKEDFIAFNQLYDMYVTEQRAMYAESKKSFGIKLKRIMQEYGCDDGRQMVEDNYNNRSLQRGYFGIKFYDKSLNK